MTGNFCRECGTKLVPKELENEGIVPYCPQCGQFRFPQYDVAVSMIVINEEKDEHTCCRVCDPGRGSRGRCFERGERRDRNDCLSHEVQPHAVL